MIFVTASHQTGLDTRSKARRPIKVGEGKVGNEPSSNPAGLLLIGSLKAMWAWWAKHFHEPKCGSGRGCRFIAWTRQQGLVLYIGYKGVNDAARTPGGGLVEAGDLSASNLPLISIPHPAWMPDGPAKARYLGNLAETRVKSYVFHSL